MRKKFIFRGAAVMIATISALFGFTGIAAAQTNSIQNTGAYSKNKITNSQTENCEVTNKNNVSAHNNTHQSANTGDVTAVGNTTVGDGWGAWDPAVWQAQGYTYEQWQSAFSGYMQSVAANWGSHTPSGGVSSGNASNSTHSAITVNIDNSNADDVCQNGQGGGKGGGSIDTTGAGSHNSIHHGSQNNTDVSNMNNVHAGNNTSQNATSGSVYGKGNTSWLGGGSGGAANGSSSSSSTSIFNKGSSGGGGSGGGGATPSGSSSSISNTGAYSKNSISNTTTNNTTTNNTNNISTVNTTKQYSSSGDVNSSYNTSAGGSSGGANNSSQSSGSVTVQ